MAKKTKGKSRAKRLAVKTAKQVLQMRPARAKAPSHERPNVQRVARPHSTHAKSRTSDEVTIVGVGASAGGLEAFSSMVRALPANPGLAIVLVQHLARRPEGAPPDLLTDWTA